MTTRNELLGLAARVEIAIGPDRELDAEIAEALGWGCVMRDPAAGHKWICWRERYRDGEWIVLPEYTASIDAALTLVPNSHEWSVNWAGNSVAEVGALPDGPTHRGLADTPALALVAASLRAIAEGMPHDHN